MKKLKRAAAFAAVAAWGLLLTATLICACIGSDTARTLFNGLIFADIALPVVIYAMMLVYRILSGRAPSKRR